MPITNRSLSLRDNTDSPPTAFMMMPKFTSVMVVTIAGRRQLADLKAMGVSAEASHRSIGDRKLLTIAYSRGCWMQAVSQAASPPGMLCL